MTIILPVKSDFIKMTYFVKIISLLLLLVLSFLLAGLQNIAKIDKWANQKILLKSSKELDNIEH